jgi:SAM-dependent methyltransferase
MNDMSYRLSQSEFRVKHLASYDATAVEQYEAWTRQISEADEIACLEDIAQVFALEAGMSVLDAGAGTGAMCRMLMRIGGLKLTALEPSTLMMQKFVSKPELSSVRICKGFCDSPDDMSLFPPDYFDVIISRQLANGLYDPLSAMANWRHWLKPQGAVLIIDGFYSRSAWASLVTDFADCLPLAANQSLATVPYLLEIAGLTVTHAGMMQATNVLPSTRTEKYLVVAKLD